MRTLFTFLLLACFTCSFAQTLEMRDANDEIVTLFEFSGLDGYVDYGDAKLTNTSTTDSIEVAVSIEQLCYVEGDTGMIQICVGILCFFPVDDDRTWGDTGDVILKLGPGDTSDDALKFTPFPVGEFGSTWKVTYFDRNDTANSVSVEVRLGECTPVSTIDFVHEVGAAFPNPAKDLINIPYQHNVDNAQLIIYNAVGVKIESVVLDRYNGQAAINVEQYVNGVYFYHVVDDKGGLSPMLSFVK